MLLLIEQVHAGVGDRFADVEAAVRQQTTGGGDHRGFGRAIVVDHGKTRLTVELPQAIAADQQRVQRRVIQLAAERIFGHWCRQKRHLQRLGQPPVEQHIKLFITDFGWRDMQRCPCTQGRPDFPGHRVKTEAGHSGSMATGVQSECLAMPVNEIGQRAVFDHHAFWLSGRAGSVNHIRQIAGRLARHQRICRLLRPLRAIEREQRQRQCRQARHESLFSEHHYWRTIGQQIVYALIGVRRIHRHIASTGLEHGQQAHQRVQATTRDDRDAIIRAHAQADQMMGKAVGLTVHLRVAQRLLADPGGNGFGHALGACLYQGMNGLTLRHAHRAGVKSVEQILALLRAHQRNISEHCLLVTHQRAQQLFEITAIALHRCLIEQRSGVVQRAEQRITLFAEVERQIELGDLTLLFDRCQRQPVHLR